MGHVRNTEREAKVRARDLRHHMSQSERTLWSYLRNSQTGFRFRRQYAIGIYVLDFYCPKLKLCVEVDGPHHESRLARDAYRDSVLASEGILTMRIGTPELHEIFSEVAEKIEEACRSRAEARGIL